MSETHDSLIERVGQWGWLARTGTLLILFGLFLALAAPIAVWQFGTAGLWAAAVATAVCLVAGWLAMAVTAVLAPPEKPAAHVLVGMSIRMSLPLLACLLVTQQSAWLTAAGFAWFLVAAFCLGLAFETAVSVGQLQSAPPSSASRRRTGPSRRGCDNAGSFLTRRGSRAHPRRQQPRSSCPPHVVNPQRSFPSWHTIRSIPHI